MPPFVGECAAVTELKRQTAKLAPLDATVLILGESGTGKELIAHALHDESPRREGAFVPINCAAIPENLLESELFGHVEGAFTGASRDKTGLIAEAAGGTLFLDEIGDIPLGLQVKLLRFLQEGEIQPVGAASTETVDTRVVAATSRDLKGMIAEGSFREDLYYRLNVITLRIPPLREREGDLPRLLEHFLQRFSKQHRRPIPRFTDEARAALESYDWPGNVRELENCIERAVILSEDRIDLAHLPAAMTQTSRVPFDLDRALRAPSLKEAMRMVEREIIQQTLDAMKGSRSRTAERLKISARSLQYKLKEHGIR